MWSTAAYVVYGDQRGKCHLPPGSVCGRRKMYKESQMVKGTAAVIHSSVASEGECGQVMSTDYGVELEVRGVFGDPDWGRA